MNSRFAVLLRQCWGTLHLTRRTSAYAFVKQLFSEFEAQAHQDWMRSLKTMLPFEAVVQNRPHVVRDREKESGNSSPQAQ